MQFIRLLLLTTDNKPIPLPSLPSSLPSCPRLLWFCFCAPNRPHEFYLQLSDFALRANLDELLRMQDANGRGVRSHAEHRIKQLDVSVVMARHYQHMFDALFPPLHAGPSAVLLKELHPFAWSLFLLCKNRLAKISADALPSFLLLVSVLRFCYVNARRASTLAALAIEPPEDICLYLCRRYAGTVGCRVFFNMYIKYIYI